MSYDGCLVDACLILSEEEYFARVLFDKEGLLKHLLSLEPKYTSAFELMLDEEDGYSSNTDTVAFSFGDMLTHVPLAYRSNWKQYYRGIRTETDDAYHAIHDNHLDRLLFCDFQNVRESELASSCWQERLDAYDK
jgi:hypothetical protein